MFELTDKQESICKEILKWYNSYPCKQYITLGGYAGTGKTSIIPYLSNLIREKGTWRKSEPFRIVYTSFTGKATSVLRKKLINNGIDVSKPIYNDVGTIHHFLYEPVFITNELGKKVISKWRKKPDILYGTCLIIIDEASMVAKNVWYDLLSFNIPIIAIGDHGQLPPVDSNNFNLMSNPDLLLTEIHRQAEDNPIIKLSMDIRSTGEIKVPLPSIDNKKVFGLNWKNKKCRDLFNSVKIEPNTVCLCGRNATRVNINNIIRSNIGFNIEKIYPDERVICLKNDHETNIMNGQLATVLWSLPLRKNITSITIKTDDTEDDELYDIAIDSNCFGKTDYSDFYDNNVNYKKFLSTNKNYSVVNLFDYGYCTTVHKSQGSEWDKVILFVERNSYQSDEDFKKWLYTAVTRAKEKLFVIYGY